MALIYKRICTSQLGLAGRHEAPHLSLTHCRLFIPTHPDSETATRAGQPVGGPEGSTTEIRGHKDLHAGGPSKGTVGRRVQQRTPTRTQAERLSGVLGSLEPATLRL